MRAQGLGHTDKLRKFSDGFHHLPQMRQCAPNNHVLDLVVICTLSLLCMSLSRVALSLLDYIQSLFRFVLRPGQVTLGTVISRDRGPGLCHEPLIAHEPVMGSLFIEASEGSMPGLSISENEQHCPFPSHLFHTTFTRAHHRDPLYTMDCCHDKP